MSDANACSVTASTQVSQPDAAISASTTIGNVSCFGGRNGSIQVNVTGGNAPYSFNWNTGDTTQNRNFLASGNYFVSVSDNNGCGIVVSSSVTQPNAGLNVMLSPTNVNCFGGNNGAVDLNVTGGTFPYSYNWSSGQTSKNIANLVASIYSVVVTDANACSTTSLATVTQPSRALNASLAVTNVKCFGGTNGAVNLTVSGGTPNYTFEWSVGSTTQNIRNLGAGIYHVTVTDSKTCYTVMQALVAQPSTAASVSVSSDSVSCFGGNNGSLNLHVTGGTAPYTYNWGLGIIDMNRTGLSAGNYTVTIEDANSCTIVATASVFQPASGIAISGVVNNVSCYNGSNGSIHLSVSGGTAPYTYNWGGRWNTQNRSNLSDGTYHVTVTDSKGCTATESATVNQPLAALAPTTSVQSEVNCYNGNNGAIQLSVTGGTLPYAYHWADGVTTENRSNLVAGAYPVTVTDKNGCSATASTQITQPGSTLSITSSITNVSCYSGENGAITLTVSGGTSAYNYNWGGGITSQNRTGLLSGNYAVTVTDHNGCMATVSVVVSQPSSAIIVDNSVIPASCFNSENGAIKINVFGGSSPYRFNWSGGVNTQNRNNIAAGNYQVIITDANGCSIVSNIVVTAPDSISLSSSQSDPACFGSQNGKIQVNAIGGTPAYHFAWSNGAVSSLITDAGAGGYSVTVTDGHGCSANLANLLLGQPNQINLAVNEIRGSCKESNNGQLLAIATGGTSPFQYLWSNNKSTGNISHLAAGYYTITVTDANECSQTGNAFVNNYPDISGDGFTHSLPCQNAEGEILLYVTSGDAPYTFKWSNGDTTQDIYNVHPGSYSVTVQDVHGCSFDTTFIIENLNSFSVNANGGGTITLGGSTEIHASGTGSNQTVFNWTPGGSLSCSICTNALAQPVQTTIYTVVGTDTNGCTASDTVSVQVIEDHSIFVPNAFTPNGDGNNDYFQIFGNLAGVHSIEVKIFDRWGEKVFESENPDFKWDGTYKGVLQNPCVYVYEMKIVFDDGHSDELKKGSITLIR